MRTLNLPNWFTSCEEATLALCLDLYICVRQTKKKNCWLYYEFKCILLLTGCNITSVLRAQEAQRSHLLLTECRLGGGQELIKHPSSFTACASHRSPHLH